ncbi:MAG: fructose-1,6-bisphosphatase, partial [Lachnospiraceae bacterium]|nr:fructose-1,6-bisphosphatase [Lachnospiraceae bacterium]
MSADKHYLEALSYRFPTISKASTEIINLSAILQLPKATEHFISDIHGEYEQFDHIIRNGSGAVKSKIEDEFGFELSSDDKRELATLIYYPRQKIQLVKAAGTNMHDWYRTALFRLIRMIKRSSMKYSRSKVRKTIDPDFIYIVDELLAENDVSDKEKYYDGIMEAIVRTGSASACVTAFAECIQRLCVNHLHVVGDIYDRGPGPNIIMDKLIGMKRDVDVQWGNHDVVWMGAASGNMACIATVLRLSARYGNLDIIEDGYGINLIPLMRFAMDTYAGDPCACFEVKYDGKHDPSDVTLDMQMHKAAAILQFKLEGQVIARHPEYRMEDRRLLDKIDYEKKTVTVYGREYPIEDVSFPTVDPANPYKLNDSEVLLMKKLQNAFLQCEKLQHHIRFLFNHGSLYLVRNNNLIFHGSIPLNKDGSFRVVTVGGESLCGRALIDKLDSDMRRAFYMAPGPEREAASDIAYYLWANEASPLFGKTRMTTFERYFIKNSETHKEPMTPYYTNYEREEVVQNIFEEFGLDSETGHIINGHVPVKQKKGESPIKCGGKLLIIDGGFSRAYYNTTGIAGYTLISNSYGLKLVYHEPFTSTEDAIKKGSDIHSETFVVEDVRNRLYVADS